MNFGFSKTLLHFSGPSSTLKRMENDPLIKRAYEGFYMQGDWTQWSWKVPPSPQHLWIYGIKHENSHIAKFDLYQWGTTFLAGLTQISPIPALSAILTLFSCPICCSFLLPSLCSLPKLLLFFTSWFIYDYATCPLPDLTCLHTQKLPIQLGALVLQVDHLCPTQFF